MGYIGVKSYNPITHHLLTSWDIQVGGDFKYFLFLPLLNQMIHFDEPIFSKWVGWSHQLEKLY